jgi:hypothetical protein
MRNATPRGTLMHRLHDMMQVYIKKKGAKTVHVTHLPSGPIKRISTILDRFGDIADDMKGANFQVDW